jgi:hypothetical protein
MLRILQKADRRENLLARRARESLQVKTQNCEICCTEKLPAARNSNMADGTLQYSSQKVLEVEYSSLNYFVLQRSAV